jgi:hypothetical protein
MGARIQLRRGSAAFWDSENPILHAGEPGLETDTHKVKYGDGSTPWRELPYSSAEASGGPGDLPSDSALQAHIDDISPHPVYDDGRDFSLIYLNARV